MEIIITVGTTTHFVFHKSSILDFIQKSIWDISSICFFSMSPLNPEATIRQTTTDPSRSLDFPSTPSPLQRRSSKFSKSTSFLDERYVLPPSRTPSKSELSQFESFVETAIVSSQQQATITPSYRNIIDCVRKRNDATMLYHLLVVLRMNGTTLNQLIKYPKQHAELIHFIFRLDPFTVPAKMSNDNAFRTLTDNFTLADAHLHFIVAIVSANSTYLIPALQALWKLLTTSEQGESVRRNQRLHAALATLIRLVPKGSADLFPIVVSGFPYRGRSDVIEYVKRCFVLLDYAPMLESQVLELIIDKALEIDVEIRIKDDGDVELDDEKFIKPNQDGIFQLELDDNVNPQIEAPTSNLSQGQIEELIDDMADKVRLLLLSCIKIITIFSDVRRKKSWTLLCYAFFNTLKQEWKKILKRFP
jgi:RNA polymerase I-specific transcription initiation factor RRN3